MFSPDDPLAPPQPAFDEPWQAQALAMADTLVRNAHLTADDWAQTLGAALKQAEADGNPDTNETYFLAVLTALEQVAERHAGITDEDRSTRRTAWEDAYHRTPHGKPVLL